MTNATPNSGNTLLSYLPFEATREQAEALYFAEEFLDPTCPDDLFILRGAAGTGKTSMVKAITDFLTDRGIRVNLAAPTGRAAKILGFKTLTIAHTIHHTIYRITSTDDDRIEMELRANTNEEYSVYIIDEASMISDIHRREGTFRTPNSLLFDLISHIKQGNRRNKVIFIGDRYQLGPVSERESVALNLNYFKQKYGLTGKLSDLTEVKRQVGDSPILRMAHEIRRRSDEGLALGNLDLFHFSGSKAAVTRYLNLYDANRPDSVVMIGCANKNVHTFNQMVRERLGYTGVLAIGDQVVVDENWADNEHFIVKGDTGIVRDIHDAIKKIAELEFVTATIEFRTPENLPYYITTRVLLDSLKTPDGKVDDQMIRNLKGDRMAKNDYYRANPYPTNDEYVGAMRLRYGHSLNGYRAQGGEWDHVLLHPWFPENHYRYAYTAITRARQSVASWGRQSWWLN